MIINTLIIMTEQRSAYQTLLYLSFVHFGKVFDSLSKKCMWNTLRNLGILTKIIYVIKKKLRKNIDAT